MNENPKPLPPIPTPLSVVWREFRVQVVPFMVFALIACAAIFVWRTLPMSGSLRGVGEGARSVITSPRVGMLQRVEVQPYQLVKAGDPLVTIVPFDPAAQLDLLQSELQLARLRLEPSLAERDAVNIEQLRVDYHQLQNELGVAEANLVQAQSILERNERAFKEKLVTADDYELSLRDRNVYQSQVKQLTASVKDIEKRLNDLRASGDEQAVTTNQFAVDLIGNLQTRITAAATNWQPVTLRAPIDGRIHVISRQEGEFVVEGEALILIASPRSERIIAYMRQPFTFEPEPGMEVEVLLQNNLRKKFTTHIAEVGAQMEAITNGLALLQQGALVDMGLPIVLSVPANVALRPGEIVSVVRRSGGAAGLLGRTQTAAADRSQPSVQISR